MSLTGLKLKRLKFSGWKLEPKHVALGVIVLAVTYLTVVPLVYVIWQSLSIAQSSELPARFGLNNYVRAYSDPVIIKLFANSFKFAFGSSMLAFVIGTGLAWMNERTNTPFKSMFYALSVVPLIIPPVLFTVSWILLASPKIGLLNLVLQKVLHTATVYFNIYSLGGMIWVDGLHYSPMAFLIMSSAFRNMDPSLEESAMMCGAGLRQTFFRITLKLSWPALLATLVISFIRAVESFEVPALLGIPGGIPVFTTAIYNAVHKYPSDFGLAGSYSMTLLVITVFGVFIQSRLTGTGKYTAITGKGYRPRQIDLGKWRYLTTAIFFLYASLIVILPFLVLLWSSLQKYYTIPSLSALTDLSWANYQYILTYSGIGRTVLNSIVLAIGSATIIMLLTAVISWVVVKSRVRLSWLLDGIASLPLVFPGMVLGVSIMVIYLNLRIGIYGTVWIMLIAYVTRYMPYGMRYNSSAMIQIHHELEESAAMSGAGWGNTFRHITLPLLKSGFAAGWIYIVIMAIRELSSSILLYSSNSKVISIIIWEFWQNGQYVELSALGILFILGLFALVILMRGITNRLGVKNT